MPKYVIERDIPGIGSLSPAELQAGAQRSCRTLETMGPQIQWVQSYVTPNTLYCIYIAPDEKSIQEHARDSGFPAHRISQVKAIIDPATAET